MTIGRTQLKKIKIFWDYLVRVVLYEVEGEEFTYRCLNDVIARSLEKSNHFSQKTYGQREPPTAQRKFFLRNLFF